MTKHEAPLEHVRHHYRCRFCDRAFRASDELVRHEEEHCPVRTAIQARLERKITQRTARLAPVTQRRPRPAAS